MDVLIPVDGSEPAEEALDYALEQFGDEALTALYVIDPADGATSWGPAGADGWLSSAREQAATVLEGAEERAAGAGADIAADSTTGRPAQGIIAYAEEGGFDHIVIGSHGREGLSRVLLGSVAETVGPAGDGDRHRRQSRRRCRAGPATAPPGRGCR